MKWKMVWRCLPNLVPTTLKPIELMSREDIQLESQEIYPLTTIGSLKFQALILILNLFA